MKANEENDWLLPPAEHKILARVKTAARLALGFVWMLEGLVPKVLYPSTLQIEMVQCSDWWIGSPEQTLYWLGIAMIPAGLAILYGIAERLAVLVATLSILVLMFLVISTNPEALHDPFGGLSKNACLFVCAALVWFWPQSLADNFKKGLHLTIKSVMVVDVTFIQINYEYHETSLHDRLLLRTYPADLYLRSPGRGQQDEAQFRQNQGYARQADHRGQENCWKTPGGRRQGRHTLVSLQGNTGTVKG